MPFSQWQSAAAPATGTSASVSIAATANAGATNQGIRLRAIEASIAFSTGTTGTGSPILLTVLNGTTQIWAMAIGGVSGSVWSMAQSDMDLRASPGASLTAQFNSAGPTGALETVNIQGDYIAWGEPYDRKTF